MSNKIKINHLKPSFYTKHTGDQYLQPKNGRGYGIISIEIHGFTFGIPLHSNIKKESGFILETTKDKKKKGLDYNKAVIIKDTNDVGRTFKIPSDKLTIIRKNEDLIIKEFSKFVYEFIYRTKINDYHVLNRTYKNSTLHYYKEELLKFTTILSNPLSTITTTYNK